MIKRKCILVLGAGKEQGIVIKHAKRMGLRVVVSDYNNRAPAIKFADHFIKASVYDPQETLSEVLKFTKTIKIDGVIAVGVDAPRTTALVAKNLGLFSHSLQTAKLATNKLLMKKAFKKNKVDTFWFAEVINFKQLKQIILDGKNKRFVLKPQDSRGGRGVLQLDKVPSLKWAYEQSKAHSPTKRVMIEELLEGPQVSTESFVLDNKIYTPGFIDREYPYLRRYAPYFIEAGGEQPTRLSQKIVNKVDQVLLQAAKAIGLHEGFIKGDIVIHNGKPKIIEVAARLSGGYMATKQIPLAIGVDFLGFAIRWSLGEIVDPDKDLKPKYCKGVAIRYWFPNPGRIIKISGEEKLKKNRQVKYYQFNFHEGDIIEPPTDLTKRFGFVICEGKNSLEAVKRAEKALNLVNITT